MQDRRTMYDARSNAQSASDDAAYREWVMRHCWPPIHLRPIHRPWWLRAWHYLTDWFTGDDAI